MIKNFSQDVAVREQIASQALAAGAAHGTTIDRLAAANLNYAFTAAKAIIDIGATSGTPDSFTVDCVVEDSANGSTWATATDASGANYAMTQATATGLKTIENIDIGRLREYVRLTVTPAFVNGTSPKVQVCALLLLGNGQEGPVA